MIFIPYMFTKSPTEVINAASIAVRFRPQPPPSLPVRAGLALSLAAETYSVRSAVIGFTYVARRAGRKQASNAAAASMRLEVVNANGSVGLTP
jgi:hypothetical protein